MASDTKPLKVLSCVMGGSRNRQVPDQEQLCATDLRNKPLSIRARPVHPDQDQMSDIAVKVLEMPGGCQLDHKTLLTCLNRLCGGKGEKISGKGPSQFTCGVPQHISLNPSHDLSPHIARVAVSTISTGHRHTGSSITGQCTGVCFNPTGVPQATGSSHRAAIVPAPRLQLCVR